jgi:hypothetical protein
LPFKYLTRRAEWQDCFALLCARVHEVQNKGWQSAKSRFAEY